MRKIFLVLSLCMIILGGCGVKKTVNSVGFDVEFTQLNLDNQTATFTVYGLPNEEEFAQIPTIIEKSIAASDGYDKKINVTVSSKKQGNTTLSFGTCVVDNGKITTNDITNVTEEEYLNYLG